MRGQNKDRALSFTRTPTDDISDFIDGDVFEPIGLKAFDEGGGALSFVKCRGWNFTEFDLFLQSVINFRKGKVQGFFDGIGGF